jgi:hypothetical protein
MLSFEAFGLTTIIHGRPYAPEHLIKQRVTLPIRFSNSKKRKKGRKKERKKAWTALHPAIPDVLLVLYRR